MKRNRSAFAAVFVVAVSLAGCTAHLKKLHYATRGSYRYANPNGVSLPEQPVPSVDDMTPQPPAPTLPVAPSAPGPSASPAAPGPSASPTPLPEPLSRFGVSSTAPLPGAGGGEDGVVSVGLGGATHA